MRICQKFFKVTILNELTYTTESNFQQLWIKFKNKKMKSIIICVTYRPPDCPLNCIQDDFRQNYVRALSMNKPIFILGDLNCNLLKDCPEKRAITELCNDLNYGVPLRTKIRRIIFHSKSNVFAVEVEYFEFEAEYIKMEVKNMKFEVEYIKIEVENLKFEVENMNRSRKHESRSREEMRKLKSKGNGSSKQI